MVLRYLGYVNLMIASVLGVIVIPLMIFIIADFICLFIKRHLNRIGK